MSALIVAGWTSAELGTVVVELIDEFLPLEDVDADAARVMAALEYFYLTLNSGVSAACGWDVFDTAALQPWGCTEPGDDAPTSQ